MAAGSAQILPVDGLAERMLAADTEKRPLRVKLGIDPSGSDLTLGHAVVLRKLRQFQDFGHTAVLVVGGFTGQVGDPSGRTATRAAQSADQVVANAQGYFDQLMRILDPARTEVVNNDTWLGPMTLADVLGYTRQMTVAQLLERDDFARRFKANAPISLSEFMYPLLQGIDSVEIHADIELGGTDQTFNNLVGRELQRSRGQAPQAVLTVPLLVGTDGVEKMGKSLGNYIAIDEPAAEQFGKVMSIPDSVVACTPCSARHYRRAEVERIEAAVAEGGSRRQPGQARGREGDRRAVSRAGRGDRRRGVLRRHVQARRGAGRPRRARACRPTIRSICRPCWWRLDWPSPAAPGAARSTAGQCASNGAAVAAKQLRPCSIDARGGVLTVGKRHGVRLS